MNTEKLKKWLREYKVNYSSPTAESIKFVLHQVIKKVEEMETEHSANPPVIKSVCDGEHGTKTIIDLAGYRRCVYCGKKC